MILLRRPIERTVAVIDGDSSGRQLDLYFGEITADPATKVFEYAVLVTSLANEVLTVAQLYRDRAAGENNFDELKNHWGWGGFTTRDLQRCRLIARIVALIYNWWTLFVRLADPDQHTEAITSRPLLLYAVGRQTRHANQTSITITSTHGKAGRVRRMLAEVAAFFTSLRPMAEQLTDLERWYRTSAGPWSSTSRAGTYSPARRSAPAPPHHRAGAGGCARLSSVSAPGPGMTTDPVELAAGQHPPLAEPRGQVTV